MSRGRETRVRGARLRGAERARYVARMFSRISARYDLLNTVMTAGRHHAWRRLATRLATGEMTGPALDVAAGTGDFALALAQNKQVTRVVGLDFTTDMLSVAARKADDRGLASRLNLMVGDAHALPFPDDAFACATVGFGVRNFIDVRQALGELARVVQPGGRVAVLEIVRLEGRGLLPRLLRFHFRYVTPWLGALLAGDREAYTYLPESVDEFLSARELAEVMTRAGLIDVSRRSLGLGSVAVLVGTRP